MTDNKLRIPKKLKTGTHKQLKIRTDMNSDVPYESAVRTSLIPLHGRKSWEQLPSLLKKIGIVLPPLFGIKGLGAIRAKIGPTLDDDKIFSKMYSQYVLFINKYS